MISVALTSFTAENRRVKRLIRAQLSSGVSSGEPIKMDFSTLERFNELIRPRQWSWDENRQRGDGQHAGDAGRWRAGEQRAPTQAFTASPSWNLGLSAERHEDKSGIYGAGTAQMENLCSLSSNASLLLSRPP